MKFDSKDTKERDGSEKLFQKVDPGDAEDGGGGWEEKILAHSACPGLVLAQNDLFLFPIESFKQE